MPYQSHPKLVEPAVSSARLWRYLDMYRFLDLLQTGELHLARGDQMDDPWEGSYGPMNAALRPHLYGEHHELMERQRPGAYLWTRTHVFINCWYLGDHESYAMWRLYDAAGKGVAIRTTFDRLREAASGPGPSVFGGCVSYIDYAKEFIPEHTVFMPYAYKRLSFAHENEFRLIAMWSPEQTVVDGEVVHRDPDAPPLALRQAVDLTTLIEAVYVSPEAPRWVHGVVSEVTSLYLPGIEVRQSDLATAPMY